MLNIKLNNKEIVVEQNLSLAEILANQACVDLHFAVAVNQSFIPRAHYANTYLQDGDVIELVAPMQGG